MTTLGTSGRCGVRGPDGNRSSLTLEHGLWQVLQNCQNPNLMPACVSVCAKTSAHWLSQDPLSPATAASCEHRSFMGEPFPLIWLHNGLHCQAVFVFSPGQTGRPKHGGCLSCPLRLLARWHKTTALVPYLPPPMLSTPQNAGTGILPLAFSRSLSSSPLSFHSCLWFQTSPLIHE